MELFSSFGFYEHSSMRDCESLTNESLERTFLPKCDVRCFQKR